MRWRALNTNSGPLKDVRVRKAIAYAVDKNFIRNALMQGTTEDSRTGIHPDSPFYNNNVEAYDVDLDKAKALLDDVQVEDKDCTEAVYRGLCSDLARPGHLSHLERPIYDFATYLAGRIG